MLGALCSLSMSGCGGSSASSPPTHFEASSGPAAPRTAFPPTPPQLRSLQAELTARLRVAGPVTGAEVYDLDTGQTLFAQNADVRRAPASVEKLYTTLALLNRLGAGARLHTRIEGTGHLGSGGVWQGDLYLRGDGDPTFGDTTFNRTWNGGAGTNAQELTAQLSARGIHSVSGQVIGDPSLFDSRPGVPSSGFAPDVADMGGQLAGLTYDHGASAPGLSPGAFAARELVLTMRSQHISARAATITSRTPHHAQTLASVRSAPLPALLRLMDVPSDDFYAEMLTKLLAAHVTGVGTTAAGAHAIAAAMRRYRIHPAIVDGSGLSRQDRSSPREVVDLLRAVWHRPDGQVLAGALPVVGIEGTVRRIGAHTVAQGQCVAKTGTLENITNLAGYCHARDGHELAFAVFLDGPSNERGIALLSKIVAAIVRY